MMSTQHFLHKLRVVHIVARLEGHSVTNEEQLGQGSEILINGYIQVCPFHVHSIIYVIVYRIMDEIEVVLGR